MKKQMLFAGLAIVSVTAPSLQAMWIQPVKFEDIFQASERMAQEARQNSERIMREAQQHFAQAEKLARECRESVSTQPDYTIQSHRDKEKGTYCLTITLNDLFGKQRPVVSVGEAKGPNGSVIKELEIETVSSSKANKQSGTSGSGERAYSTQSSTIVVHEGGSPEQSFESSQASVKNGVLIIKYALPKDIGGEKPAMEFANGQLRLEFPMLQSTKTRLSYTLTPDDDDQQPAEDK